MIFIEGEHYELLNPAHPNGYKYQLTRAYHHTLVNYSQLERTANLGPWVKLDHNYLFLAPGYMWNGPDVIRDADNLMRASLVHDSLYQMIAHGVITKRPWKRHADNEFVSISGQDGRAFSLRVFEWLAVRFFGGATGRYRPAHSL